MRTAHLERAKQLDTAAILYRRRRYDFEESLTDGLETRRVSARQLAGLLFKSNIEQIEVNEPMSTGMVFTASALIGLGVRRLVRGRPALVVTYAIGNLDPAAVLARKGGVKAGVRAVIYRLLSRAIWRRLDRVVYGTDAAREEYRAAFTAPSRAEVTTIPALPVARDLSGAQKHPGTVLFLGALVPRKGLPLVLEAWPLVQQVRPDARLTIIGKGSLLETTRERAAADDSIELIVDPPRETIFQTLDASQVLVLPSQPTPAWREQVGLPIVEGLASGCSIVTTTETGLADWLLDHGHAVIPATADAPALAAAILDQLTRARPSEQILADLPDVDGRLAADKWLFRTAL